MTYASLVLASASPRRRELLSYLVTTFQAVSNDAEEQDRSRPDEVVAALPTLDLPLDQHPALIAWRKARAACAELPDSVIIGADTIVVLEGEVIGKPANPEHAQALLQRLSGRRHTVYTGLAVICPAQRPQYAIAASEVQVAALDAATIAAYVATGEPLDKAGAYGIQGLGGRLVEQVVGSYTNVVGLPLMTLHGLLEAAGVADLVAPDQAYRRWLHDQGKEPLPCPPTLP